MQLVPRFFLYGEAEEASDSRFLHLETIPERARPHGWRIAPHRHPGLLQLLLATRGGGMAQFDGAEHGFAAPCLMLLPPAVIHGFAFRPGTDGWVLSIALPYAAELLAEDSLPEEAALLPLDRAALLRHRVLRRFAELAEEMRGNRPGRAAALSAQLRLVLLALARLRAERPDAAIPAAPDALLFARFRALVEQWYREDRGLQDYRRALGLSEKKLAALCRAHAGRSPLQIIHARKLVEARRSLRYGNQSVAEIAYALGFRDPAYFSRFYRRLTGEAPRRPRAAPR
ncbi:helix-turn-helix domain-containing protein [Pseudoroseomonas cervicalis]|uniref:helix-turn-helix domain-containing protein n=1 Tax=Teichococcus cervicalis TaxID=204525 RepID=UPI0022F171C1|nr:helix-turn-helix domain-containing protein [Pseudoroseomonas cervicalis]WBV43918.1 helix-turn-helix domain-containing protein [Pseudoroseomonas cervicalis]